METATDICSVCVSKEQTIAATCTATEGYRHSQQLTLLIEECMKKAGVTLSDVAAVSVSTGPGSFTALRVGASVAKGICYALDLPLLAIDTLAALAYTAWQVHPSETAIYLPMIDARRMEVYTAQFSARGKRNTETTAKIIDATSYSSLFAEGKDVVFCGNGAVKAQSVITHSQAHFLSVVCNAQQLVPLAWAQFQQSDFVDVAYFSPHYFKAPNITTPRKKLL